MNGKDYLEVVMNSILKEYIDKIDWHGFRNLDDVYKKPSDFKKEIWQRYRRDPAIRMLTVLSFNCCFFTLGYLMQKEDDWYICKETSSKHLEHKLDDTELALLNAKGICI